MSTPARELQRQQLLLGALLGAGDAAALAPWLAASRAGAVERGLAAYRANAGALAERALAAAYPTLQQLLGDDAFAALARAFWQRHPPSAGDIGVWGAALPGFVADAEQLAAEPYLADVARVDWAVHCSERAADVDAAASAASLQLLATHDPAQLWLQLAPGTALVASAHPVVAIWQAHRSAAADRFAAVRNAFAAGLAQTALVARDGWRASVTALPADSAAFVAALLDGAPLAQALQRAGDAFDFERWLIDALQCRCIASVTTQPHEALR